MVISLIHPSRGRADKALLTAKNWLEKSGTHDDDYILSIDNDDPDFNKYTSTPHTDLGRVIYHDNKSVVEAANHAAKWSKGDILIYTSDDFLVPDNWGQLILKEFEGVTEPMLLKVDDMLQKFDVPVLTIPIMNRALYERLGYFFHPDFKSMFCDEHLYWVAKKLGALKFAPHLKFPHEHVSIGKAPDDETYRNSAKNWEQGKAAFAKHKAAGFPV